MTYNPIAMCIVAAVVFFAFAAHAALEYGKTHEAVCFVLCACAMFLAALFYV